MATENIVIQIREDGSRVVIRNMKDIGESARGAEQGINTLRRALIALGGALGLHQLREWMDTWTQAIGKVNVFTSTLEETNVVMQRLFEVAQRTRQPISGVTDSFHQLSIAASALGASQNQLIQFTEAIGKALAIQGTNANTARGGIIQLGQAMNEGIVRGQEYNSMINSMPVVLKTVANHLEGVDGSLAKLRQRMLDGKLYSKDFFAALLQGAGELDVLFNRSGKTIGQAFTIVENALIKYVAEVDKAYGISQTLFELSKWGASNIDNLAKSLLVLVSPGIAIGIWKITEAVVALGAVALANPFIAAAFAITAAITALVAWRDQITISQKDQTTLGDYMRATWQSIGEMVSSVTTWMGESFVGFGSVVAEIFTKIVGGIKFALNIAMGLIAGFYGAGKAVFEGLRDAMMDLFVQGMNGAISAVESGLNQLLGAVNVVRDKLGLDQIALISVDRVQNEFAGKAADLGDAVKQAFTDALSIDYVSTAIENGTSVVSKAFEGLSVKAREFALQRREQDREDALARAAAGATLGQHGAGEDFAAVQDKKLEKLERQLRTLLSRIQPSTGALFEMAHAEDILNQAVQRKLITGDQQLKYLEVLKLHYQDIIDPMGAFMRESEKEINYLSLLDKDRLIEEKTNQKVMELRKKGIEVTSAENEAIRSQIAAIEESGLVAKERQKIYEEFVGIQETFNRGVQAANQLYEKGKISLQQYNLSLRDLRISYLETQKDFASGVERGVLKIQSKWEEMATVGENAVAGVFDRMETMIDNFVDHGKLSFSDFFRSIFADLAKIQLRVAFFGNGGASVAGGLASYLGGGSGGGSGGLMSAIGNGKSAYDLYSGGFSAAGVADTMNYLGYANGADPYSAFINGGDAYSQSIAAAGSANSTPIAGGYFPVIGGALSAYTGAKKFGPVGGFAMGAGSVALGGGVSGLAAGTGFMSGAGASLAAIPGWGWAVMGAMAILGSMGGGEMRSGAGYDINRDTGKAFVHGGPSGGEIAGEQVRSTIESAYSSLTGLLRDLGSKSTIEQFTAGLESSKNGKGGTFAGGFIDGQLFGRTSAEKIYNQSLSPEEAVVQFTLDLKRSVVDALRKASDIPKTIADQLKDVDISKLTGDQIDMFLEMIAQVRQFQVALNSLPFENLKNLTYDLTAHLINAAGGIGNLQQGLSAISAFLTESERMAAVRDNVVKTMTDLGFASITTSAQFKNLIMSFKVTDEATAKTFAALLAVAPAFKAVADYTESITSTSQQARDLKTAFDNESRAVRQSIEYHTQYAKTITDFQKGLLLGKSSPLTPEQRYGEAKQQYQDNLMKAFSGDENAQKNVQSLAQAFLDASHTLFASGDPYNVDFFQVQGDMKLLANWATDQVSKDQQQLDKMTQQVSVLIDINNNVIGLQQAIINMAVAMSEGGLGNTGGAAGIAIESLYNTILNRASDAQGKQFWVEALTNGGVSFEHIKSRFYDSPEYKQMHGIPLAVGMPRVPYDGMPAILHAEEAVLNAEQAEQWRNDMSFANYGSSPALVNEIKALRDEVALLRDQQRKETQLMADVTVAAHSRSAEIVVSGTKDAAKQAEWIKTYRPKIK